MIDTSSIDQSAAQTRLQRLTKIFLCAIAASALMLTVAQAETRALLIGVSDYEASDLGIADLKGPANDIRLLQTVLTERGVSDFRILADGVEGGVRPTRAAILAAFDALARDAEQDDFIFIHFSGHGSQQPDQNGDETDGLDEVFLAIDSNRAPLGDPRILNAIVDDEIGEAVAKIRARGADVWMVIDSCHSGSGLRAVSSNVAVRFVDPASFGIDVTAQAPAEPGLDLADDNEGDLAGGFLAFYSARSSEIAREVKMQDGDAGWYGIFTAKLAARLSTVDAVSFRQLFQATLADLNDSTFPGAARLQTPSWEGNLIDATVFGGRDTVGLRRFRVTRGAIEAGLIHGISEGTLVALVADAAAPADAIIGYGQVERVEPTRAVLRPVAASCEPRSAILCAEEGTLSAGAAFAQIVGHPIDREVRLAPVLDLATGTRLDASAAPMVTLAGAMAAAQEAGHRLRLDAAAYDVDVAWDGARLWFGPRSTIEDSPVGLSWGADDSTDLTALLIRIERAETLARLFNAVESGSTLLNPNPVAVSARISAVDVDALAGLASGIDPIDECERARLGIDRTLGNPLESGADVKQCDILEFTAQGLVAGAWDVNRVYIDAQYCIGVEYELIEGARQMRRIGREKTMCSDCPTGYAAGEEQLFIVVTESVDNAEPLNLTNLLENCGGQGVARSAESELMRTLLEARSRRPDIRGSFGSSLAVGDIWVERFSWRILPKEVAFVRLGRLPSKKE
ncbi:MAG: caspase family protein [Pseudomonadota bacterium]